MVHKNEYKQNFVCAVKASRGPLIKDYTEPTYATKLQ